MTPVLYTGRAPKDYREMVALYARHAAGEILLPDHIIAECLRIQRDTIEQGTLKEQAIMVRGRF